ncbi:hypothetical protein M218_27880 [Burkholderia pseudomallei MSHR338]|uniref:Uncharacterized protein n=2 Tax=Burkholderia pseudomallei TaxID=28450 RepID=A0A0E1VY22_BURPE|nr:hypothetical protein BURPS1106A_A2983 [Burkholderia pseudomallei 1106a]EDO83720.1 hypothetical protein BURPS406E_0389 [Burkholderia pseudomallei 406e]EDU10140.1 hypothetical protein BURPS1655_J0183 [Burkholderia pseudomallei 1655]EEP50753.1 conserved hypothetical protein [Burkholderia pseudomallei MSHR346]EES22203.1 hypothetical protein BURPS1106B_2188 [Burkholderia pseudomallei 1106b]EET05835.1 hypothetical protein BURPS1710A_A2279 [Burkholderia pseudomallei 1710a]EQA85810.1 hypothetical 
MRTAGECRRACRRPSERRTQARRQPPANGTGIFVRAVFSDSRIEADIRFDTFNNARD